MQIARLIWQKLFTLTLHQRVIGLVNITKDVLKFLAPVAQMVKCVSNAFSRDQSGFESVFWRTFFLPFQISDHIIKAFIFNKNEGNNQKVENKVSGRVRV